MRILEIEIKLSILEERQMVHYFLSTMVHFCIFEKGAAEEGSKWDPGFKKGNAEGLRSLEIATYMHTQTPK